MAFSPAAKSAACRSSASTPSEYVTSLRAGIGPRRNWTTTTMHVHQEIDATERTMGATKSHHFGPAMKISGGRLGYVYEEGPSRIKLLHKSLDPAELLQMFSFIATRPATSTGFSRGTQGDATVELAGESLVPMVTVQATRSTGSVSIQPCRPSTSLGHYRRPDAPPPSFIPAFHTSSSFTSPVKGGVGGATSGKMVYWDGLKHHVVDIPAEGGEAGFEPPRINARQLAHSSESVVGRGVTHLTESVRLVSSRLRPIPNPKESEGRSAGGLLSRTRSPGGSLASSWPCSTSSSTFVDPSQLRGPIPGPYGPTTTSYGLAPYAPAHLAVSFVGRTGIKEATLKAYGAHKIMYVS